MCIILLLSMGAIVCIFTAQSVLELHALFTFPINKKYALGQADNIEVSKSRHPHINTIVYHTVVTKYYIYLHLND
jgi:hypothetical protein